MDLSTIEGLTLTDEQKAAIEAQAKADIDAEVLGLKTKNDELLSEKKAASDKAAEAERLAEEARLEKARKAGEVETIEKSLTEKFEVERLALTGQIERLNGEILGGKKESIIAGMTDKFTVAPEIAQNMLSGMVHVERTDTGVVTSYKDLAGNLITTDSAKFMEYLKTNDSFKGILKGVDSSGGGASGGSGNGGGANVKANLTGNTTEKATALASKIPGFKDLPVR